jgi:hypothetical protein
MKKIFLLFLALTTFTLANAQKSKFDVKVGIVTQLPVNVYQTTTIDVGSSMAELDYKYSKNIRVSLTSGFLRFKSDIQNFYNLPILAGGKYFVSNSMYFGANAGIAFFNKEYPVSSRYMWSSYVGATKGHVSVNLQYFNWYQFNNANNNLSIFLAYTL